MVSLRFVKRLARLSLVAWVATGAANQALASAFQLYEQNAVQTGNFGAGGAASAEDASTGFFNPAGLTRLTNPSIVLAANEIFFNTHITGNVTTANSLATQTASVHQASGGTSNLLPSFHYARPINERTVFGFSITTPYGLATDFKTNTPLQYAATATRVQATDFSPSIGFKVNEKLALGLGVDAQRINATFDLVTGMANTGGASDHYSHNTAADWGFGWHAGALYQLTPATRLGLSYHSHLIHHAKGSSLYINEANGNQFYTPQLKADVTLPASTMLSAHHELSPAWAVDGTVIYTQWSVFKRLTMQNVAMITGFSDLTPEYGLGNITINEHFRNAWRAAVGTSYQLNREWLVRTGVGYDQSPITTAYRNTRLADTNRYAVAVGTHYQATPMVGFDVGWTHLMMPKAGINNTQNYGDAATVTTIGSAKNSADVVGLQITWNFA